MGWARRRGRWSDPLVRLIRVRAGLECIFNDDIKVRLGAAEGEEE